MLSNSQISAENNKKQNPGSKGKSKVGKKAVLSSRNKNINIEKMAITGRIARTIAHEVRNPLTNIHLAVEQLKYEIDPESETAMVYLDMVNRNAIRINQLVTELLEAVKPAELENKNISISKVIEDSIELLSHHTEQKDVEIKKTYENIPELFIDANKIKVVFANLLLNAVESIPENKKGIIDIEIFSHSNNVIVSISDNGQGISAENLPRIFEPFFTTKKISKGLGLAAVQNIIYSHKAQIDVSSQVNKGSAFTIIFPLA